MYPLINSSTPIMSSHMECAFLIGFSRQYVKESLDISKYLDIILSEAFIRNLRSPIASHKLLAELVPEFFQEFQDDALIMFFSDPTAASVQNFWQWLKNEFPDAHISRVFFRY